MTPPAPPLWVTLAGSWLSKASDGSFGLASRSYSLDTVNPL